MINVPIEKRFDEGLVVGEINIDYNGQDTQVSIVFLHFDFDCGLTRHPTLEFIDGKWVLVAHYNHEVEGQVHKPIENKYSQELVNIILQIKDEHTPKFSS